MILKLFALISAKGVDISGCKISSIYDGDNSDVKKSANQKYSEYILKKSLLKTYSDDKLVGKTNVIMWKKDGICDNMVVRFKLPEYEFVEEDFKGDDISSEWECTINDFDVLYERVEKSARTMGEVAIDTTTGTQCISIDSTYFILRTKDGKYFSNIINPAFIDWKLLNIEMKLKQELGMIKGFTWKSIK